MPDNPSTPRERWVESQARDALGPEVRLARRIVLLVAGGRRRGAITMGYQVCRRVPDGEVVLGMSPAEDAPLDLAAPGTPEAALEDALRRRAAGKPPYADAEPGCPPLVTPPGRSIRPPRPEPELTTSSISLPLP